MRAVAAAEQDGEQRAISLLAAAAFGLCTAGDHDLRTFRSVAVDDRGNGMARELRNGEHSHSNTNGGIIESTANTISRKAPAGMSNFAAQVAAGRRERQLGVHGMNLR